MSLFIDPILPTGPSLEAASIFGGCLYIEYRGRSGRDKLLKNDPNQSYADDWLRSTIIESMAEMFAGTARYYNTGVEILLRPKLILQVKNGFVNQAHRKSSQQRVRFAENPDSGHDLHSREMVFDDQIMPLGKKYQGLKIEAVLVPSLPQAAASVTTPERKCGRLHLGKDSWPELRGQI